jgi:hypothetical protein
MHPRRRRDATIQTILVTPVTPVIPVIPVIPVTLGIPVSLDSAARRRRRRRRLPRQNPRPRPNRTHSAELGRFPSDDCMMAASSIARPLVPRRIRRQACEPEGSCLAR